MNRAKLSALPRSKDDDYSSEAIRARRELAERAAGQGLEHIAGAPVDPQSARGNIENLIGFAQIPLGLAGPLGVDTSAGWREVYVPMATNEGALVASHSRGMRLLAAGEGPRSRVVHEGLTQNPMLVFDDASAAIAAAAHVDGLLPNWREVIGTQTRHGALSGATTQIIGRRLILRLEFTTGDAIGINMAAKAADHCSRSLAEKTGARACYVHGQDVEKRANARALIEGRGRSVVVDATIPRAALAGLARTTPEAMVEIHRSYSVGFAQLGTHNWLVQSANGLAAVLLACGQDVAYLGECATGFLDLEQDPNGDLYASATLPSLLVGTVGGGSQKGTAAECLAILGCAGAGHANTFAEILGAVVLAGDLSLLAAFASQEFIAAHEKLGRNRPAPGS
ncbi:MAG: 3-hydroxy-3-methylglutaryl-CoA reductase [Planctomycetota bacterium]